MEITEVKIFPREGQDKKLRAYASVVFDSVFVVRNIKIIEGARGLFIAMPSRRLKEACPFCRHKNVLRSKFCNECGKSLPQRTEKEDFGRQDLSGAFSEHKDIAHPLTVEFRDILKKKILSAYEAGRNRAKDSPNAHHFVE